MLANDIMRFFRVETGRRARQNRKEIGAQKASVVRRSHAKLSIQHAPSYAPFLPKSGSYLQVNIMFLPWRCDSQCLWCRVIAISESQEFMKTIPSWLCSFPYPALIYILYDVGLGFIYLPVSDLWKHKNISYGGEICTFRLPPVIVTLTNRRVYVILFLARPLGVFFFSCGST